MDIPTNIENALKKFNGLRDDEKTKVITNTFNKLSNEKSLKNIIERHLKNSINIDVGVKEIIGENGKRANAKADVIDDKKVIFIDTEKVLSFYSALLKINKRDDLNEDEILTISYYIHEYIHHLQKGLWKIDTMDYDGQVAYVILETLTEILSRRLTIDFLSDIYKNKELFYFKEILNRSGAYNKTTSCFNKFFQELGKVNIFDKIVDMLKNIDDPNKNPKKIIKSLLVIINDGTERRKELKRKDIINILLGKKTLGDIWGNKTKES